MKTSELQKNIIMSAAQRRGIANISVLADRCGIPASTLHRKMKMPWGLTLHDLYSIDRQVRFTELELSQLIRGRG